MSMKAIRKAQQTTVEEIATRAATGVARALAARQAAGIALSSAELAHVNGGFTLQYYDSTPPYILDDPFGTLDIWGMSLPPETDS